MGALNISYKDGSLELAIEFMKLIIISAVRGPE